MHFKDIVLFTISFPYFRRFNLPYIEIKPFDIVLLPILRSHYNDYYKQYKDYTFIFLIFTIYQRIKNGKRRN